MAVEPTGVESLPLARLADLVAACPSFQSWVNAENAEEALARIHFIVANTDGLQKPFAMVDYADGWGVSRTSTDGWTDSGELVLVLEGDVPAEYADSERDAYLHHTNKTGAIIADMKRLVPYSQHIQIKHIYRHLRPIRASKSERNKGNDYIQSVFVLTY